MATVGFTPQFESSVLALYAKGMSIFDVARLSGCCKSSVANIIKRNGVLTHAAQRRADHRVPAHHPLYSVWRGMRSRCHDIKCPSWSRYGGRGIKVCSRWYRDFWAFVSDMGPRPSPLHSLDRIDNRKGYAPSNCRWATSAEQQRNRRDNLKLTVGKETMLVLDWARAAGLSRSAIVGRLKRGCSPAEAIRKAL